MQSGNAANPCRGRGRGRGRQISKIQLAAIVGLAAPQDSGCNVLRFNDLRIVPGVGYTPGYTETSKSRPEADSDPDLVWLIEVWPTLPEYLRTSIRMLIDALKIN
jgi:hypothetical protein